MKGVIGMDLAKKNQSFELSFLRGYTQVAALQLLLLVLKDGHGRPHAQEAKLFIERLLAWNGIQNDLLVTTRALDEVTNDLLAQASALVAWHDRDVAEVLAISSISQPPTRADETGVLVHKALEHAVRENRL